MVQKYISVSGKLVHGLLFLAAMADLHIHDSVGLLVGRLVKRLGKNRSVSIGCFEYVQV